jgi:hypothetical protein
VQSDVKMIFYLIIWWTPWCYEVGQKPPACTRIWPMKMTSTNLAINLVMEDVEILWNLTAFT